MKFKESIGSFILSACKSFVTAVLFGLITAIFVLFLLTKYTAKYHESTPRRICARYHICDVPIQTKDNTDGKVRVILVYYTYPQAAEKIPSPEYLKAGIREKLSEIIGTVDAFKTIYLSTAQFSDKILKELKAAEPESCPITLQHVFIDAANRLPDAIDRIYR